MTATGKGVFLDRDGTIIADAHYLREPAEVELLPGAAAALAQLRDAGFLLFLFTNQSGVGRGFFPLETVHRCNARMLELLGLGPNLFAEVCIAPEAPDQPSLYRKPSPRFIQESISRHQLVPAQCWMVGDKPSDVAAGRNAGIRAALISDTPLPPAPQVFQYESLFAFAQAATSQTDRR